jgi:hypothetical protein
VEREDTNKSFACAGHNLFRLRAHGHDFRYCLTFLSNVRVIASSETLDLRNIAMRFGVFRLTSNTLMRMSCSADRFPELTDNLPHDPDKAAGLLEILIFLKRA